jgi:hypothetical protein
VRGGGTKPLLGALKPQHVYMAGYSQSAIDVAPTRTRSMRTRSGPTGSRCTTASS